MPFFWGLGGYAVQPDILDFEFLGEVNEVGAFAGGEGAEIVGSLELAGGVLGGS